ncbi:hypothetical protein H2201_004997 [Coniosporium apollinis]|uniref:C2H2-type domain-containing protein n=1 Tax=Coniosporium apollinis TaxID=61459 RepID=A0ABQ9NUF0_9PEZI|nr:hypothetical protein H2201_004997 [Coniosporium apollinis]
MPPRFLTNPPPKTESAREARKSFFCELCQKGYSRMNEYEAHQGSYDHQHKQRLKDMKHMQRDPNAADKARRAERKADEKSGLITIKPLKLESVTAAKGGFKKGGFKNAFGAPQADNKEAAKPASGFRKAFGGVGDEFILKKTNEEGSDTDDCGYEYYDPRKPTGCGPACAGKST